MHATQTTDTDDFEFWFEFASTYSYLAAGRIAAVAEEIGVRPIWRPFLLGPIFQAQGWNDSPFNIYPAKGRYMWRDMQRRCEHYDLPFRQPSEFPRNGLRAARVATALFADERWQTHGPDFVRAVYRANFALDRNIAEEAVLREVLSELPLDADAVLSASKQNAAKDLLRASTERAQSLGIFGAPAFTVGAGPGSTELPELPELFWGDDRLDDALDWWRKRRRTET